MHLRRLVLLLLDDIFNVDLLGLCLGSGAVFFYPFGQRDEKGLKEGMFAFIYTHWSVNDYFKYFVTLLY